MILQRQAIGIFGACELLLRLAMPSEAFAQSNDAFKAISLFTVCSPPVGLDRQALDIADQACGSYFRGLTDGLFLMKGYQALGRGNCLPSDTGVSVAEAKAEFLAYLAKHPEVAQTSAAIVASFAIITAHGC